MGEPERVTPKPAAGFLSLPASRIGKWSAWLLVVSLILVLLNNLVIMPRTEQNTDLQLAQRIFNLFVFLCAIAAGLTGLLAVVIKRERSWVLFVSILLLIFAVAMNAGPLLYG